MIRSDTATRRMTWSRDDYHRMGETGIIPRSARVELIEGEILTMSPIGPGHSSTVMLLDRFFQDALGGNALCRVQSPVALSEDSEPEPDIAIVRPDSKYYRDRHPAPADVLLIIEVADSSIDFDLYEKAGHYARYGILEYWVVDLNRNAVVVHRNPRGSAYETVTHQDQKQRFAPAAFPDALLDLGTILQTHAD